jgi:hypothetical protein
MNLPGKYAAESALKPILTQQDGWPEAPHHVILKILTSIKAASQSIYGVGKLTHLIMNDFSLLIHTQVMPHSTLILLIPLHQHKLGFLTQTIGWSLTLGIKIMISLSQLALVLTNMMQRQNGNNFTVKLS